VALSKQDMKSVEFKGTITPNGEIVVPSEIASDIPTGRPLHVVLLWEAPDEESHWREAAFQRFPAAYVPEDSVFEKLMDEPR